MKQERQAKKIETPQETLGEKEMAQMAHLETFLELLDVALESQLEPGKDPVEEALDLTASGVAISESVSAEAVKKELQARLKQDFALADTVKQKVEKVYADEFAGLADSVRETEGEFQSLDNIAKTVDYVKNLAKERGIPKVQARALAAALKHRWEEEYKAEERLWGVLIKEMPSMKSVNFLKDILQAEDIMELTKRAHEVLPVMHQQSELAQEAWSILVKETIEKQLTAAIVKEDTIKDQISSLQREMSYAKNAYKAMTEAERQEKQSDYDAKMADMKKRLKSLQKKEKVVKKFQLINPIKMRTTLTNLGSDYGFAGHEIWDRIYNKSTITPIQKSRRRSSLKKVA